MTSKQSCCAAFKAGSHLPLEVQGVRAWPAPCAAARQAPVRQNYGSGIREADAVLGTVQVKKLVDSARERARNILSSHEAELHLLATTLMDKETMSGTQARP